MKYKTNELTGALLDAAVMLADGFVYEGGYYWAPGRIEEDGGYRWQDGVQGDCYRHPLPYSTDWNHGGPLMERDGISPERSKPDSVDACDPSVSDGRWMWVTELACGPTMLVAAMRHKVASRFGEWVELP